MNRGIKWLLKAAVAGVLALTAASVICLLYSNPSIHSTNQTGATDYIWEPLKFTATMKEGIAWHRTDENGFFSTSSVSRGMDILLMGSSHAEAQNVFEEQSLSFLLEAELGQSVYNIAISGHTFLRCVKNLENALAEMKPTGYVVIETSDIVFSEKEIEDCLEGRMKTIPSYDSGLIRELQKISYLRLAYSQLSSMLDREAAEKHDTRQPIVSTAADGADEGKNGQNTAVSPEAYARLMRYVSSVCESHGVQAVIFYHPTLSLQTDGSALAGVDADGLTAIQQACLDNGVTFVDMTGDFLDMYVRDFSLPHGFCNTKVATGHLNRYGHETIAARLAQVIASLDSREGSVS